jgi:hypothetical protein
MQRRRHMDSDSDTCENDILQKEEAVSHIFLKCNFSRKYILEHDWNHSGVQRQKFFFLVAAARSTKHKGNAQTNTHGLRLIHM